MRTIDTLEGVAYERAIAQEQAYYEQKVIGGHWSKAYAQTIQAVEQLTHIKLSHRSYYMDGRVVVHTDSRAYEGLSSERRQAVRAHIKKLKAVFRHDRDNLYLTGLWTDKYFIEALMNHATIQDGRSNFEQAVEAVYQAMEDNMREDVTEAVEDTHAHHRRLADRRAVFDTEGYRQEADREAVESER